MKRQTVLFFKKQYNLDCIRKVVIRDIESVDNSECYVDYDGRKIAVSFDKPSECNIKGYISVSTKENKKETQCLENVSCTIKVFSTDPTTTSTSSSRYFPLRVFILTTAELV